MISHGTWQHQPRGDNLFELELELFRVQFYTIEQASNRSDQRRSIKGEVDQSNSEAYLLVVPTRLKLFDPSSSHYFTGG